MLLRIALLLAIVVLRPVAAWAEGFDPTSATGWTDFLKMSGPYGLVVIAGYIAWSRDKENRNLNAQLVTATGRAEKVAGDITSALKSLEEANRATADLNGERWDTVKGMSGDLGRIATGVGGNADALRELRAANNETIRDLKTTVEGLRADVQALWRERRQ